MYIVDNGYGFEVRLRGRKIAEFATYEEACDYIKSHS